MSGFNDDVHRRHVEKLESLRLEIFLIQETKILEALKVGRSVDPELIDSSPMKQRYLEALEVYNSLGLTPSELYKNWRIWLWRPGDDKIVVRQKTISMSLRRLRLAGLARREREGHAYRYFITMNGRERLNYYKKRSEEEKKSKIN